MATAKKQEKEQSVEERLKLLYELQTILTEIDRIRTLRGELPNEVKDREDEIIRYQTRIQKHEDEIAELKAFLAKRTGDIATSKQKIARYDEQINDVRNSREFALLEKEKEYEVLEVELCEKHIRETKAKIEAKMQEIAQDKESLSDNEHILDQKRKELKEITDETRVQEEELRAKAEEVKSRIDDERTLKAFLRIRKNARNGLGIVAVQRSACGGCFNRIPPQRQLDIKMHKKVIVCEYCGRIMIDSALAGIEEAPVAPVHKKRGPKPKVKAVIEAELQEDEPQTPVAEKAAENTEA